MTDKEYMAQALQLAQKAEGWTSPNPLVGAVIVKDGQVIGAGYHQKAGTPHAEVHALAQAGENSRGGTVYVTLEPCSHFGRTPPCADALIKARVKRVVVAMVDPNPRVAGQGIARLREAGIEVEVGVLEEQARLMNEVFIKHITTGLPFVAVKTALTLDGKIATKDGSSQWITGEKARAEVHRLRHCYDAILAGIGTVLADDPQLTVRLPEGRYKNPTRIIIDSALRMPLDARVLDQSAAPTIIYYAAADEEKAGQLRKKGVLLVSCPDREGRVDLAKVIADLPSRGITGVLVEGGPQINGSLLDQDLIDKVYFFIGPKLVGSHQAPGIFGGTGISKMAEAVAVKNVTIANFGEDILITGYPKRQEG